MNFNMALSSDGNSTIVLVDDDGNTRTINQSDPNFTRIAEALVAGEDPSEWLTGTTEWFEAVYDEFDEDPEAFGDDPWDDDDNEDEDEDDFDPAPVIENLSDTIERYRREGRDATGLVLFMHRLAKNPSRRSREQLFQWTVAKDMTIDLDGFVVGFKGVHTRSVGSDLFPLDRYPFQSSAAGHGIVDGVEIEHGNLPMGVGAVIEIPRDEVQDDPNIGCHVGLHVGSHSYATNFAPVLIEVRFDPADVVSVPSDCGFQKLRCCRYEVVAVHELDDDDLSAHEAEATWNADEALDSFADVVPQGFLASLKARLLGRGR